MSQMTVIEYVTEEVRRQGHDTAKLDGIQRVGWMLGAWAYAMEVPLLTPEKILYIGQRIEPFKNKMAPRTVNIGIRGDNSVRFADYRKVPQLLRELVEDTDKLEPLEFYRRFIMIHPFLDGNGRSGKVILNWLNGTLHNPIFPPDDFWGKPIQNP